MWIINNITTLQKTINRDEEKAMLDIHKVIPQIKFDLRYAGANNFTNHALYPTITTTYLRKPAVDKLKRVQQELETKGYGLKIFDAYRPYSVTEKLWEPVKDERYAANPKKGSGHNRGVAVDLTIITIATDQELDMGTGFDNFSDTAHINFISLPAEVVKNRQLLITVMKKYGFLALETEWWHFYLPDSNNYELLDVKFKQLKKLNKKYYAKRNID